MTDEVGHPALRLKQERTNTDLGLIISASANIIANFDTMGTLPLLSFSYVHVFLPLVSHHGNET